MANTRKPQAEQILDELLAMSNARMRLVLAAAREYGDHSSIKGVTGIGAGDRLLRQIEFGLTEVIRKGY